MFTALQMPTSQSMEEKARVSLELYFHRPALLRLLLQRSINAVQVRQTRAIPQTPMWLLAHGVHVLSNVRFDLSPSRVRPTRGWAMKMPLPELAVLSASRMRVSIRVGRFGRFFRYNRRGRDFRAGMRKARAGSPGLCRVVGTGVDPVTYRFSGGRSAN